MSNYNLVWDNSITCDNDFRSHLLGEPMYDMNCSKCLTFIGAYHKPEDCKANFCLNCGNKIKE